MLTLKNLAEESLCALTTGKEKNEANTLPAMHTIRQLKGQLGIFRGGYLCSV